MTEFNSAVAILNQLASLKSSKKRLFQLAKAVNKLNDLPLSQYAQLFAIAKEFKPDLIVELGRGYGNSTAVLTEAASQLGNTKVISVCLSNDWQEHVLPKIARVVPERWFSKLDARIANILDVKFENLIKGSERIIFLWDAHGWDVAEYVLGKVLPSLRDKEHLILVHDISYFDRNPVHAEYHNKGIWKGYPGDEVENPPYLILGSMSSPFEEMVVLYDFASRNTLQIKSVQKEINDVISKDHAKAIKFRKILGRKMGQTVSSFHYFSLNTLPKNQKIFYPRFHKPKKLSMPKFPQLSFDKRKNKYASSFEESRPMVSIVTPSYNSGKYIEECIQSVLNQDYPFVEHIVQDGGSTDNTVKILQKYSKPEYKERIKWVSESDKGQSDGLNKALQRASGEVLLVLNADDVLLPYACSWGVLHLKINPNVAVVYGDEYIIDEAGKIIHEFTGPRYDYEKLLCVEIVPAAQTAFIRRSYFEQVGLGADSTLGTCPDYEIWVRIGAKFPMKYTTGFVAKYRWHTGSEGQQPSMILKMVEAKKQVMDRVFNDKKTPKRIKKLRKRAYAGVEIWGAITNMQLRGPIPITAKLVISSFLNYPPNIAKYRKLIPGGIISFSQFVLKKYEKKLFS